LKKLVLIVGVGLPLLLLNLVPGIGTIIATVGSITLAATIVCLDFLDAALERRRLRFREKLGLIFRSLPASGSFSLVCLGLVSIPLLNLLTIPLCVASGTLFFCDRIYPKLPKPPLLPNSNES
jgi:CysZ protein